MKWGDKHVNGCKIVQCPKLHPELCVRSLALECLDRKCQAKLHTSKCKRSRAPLRNGPASGQHVHQSGGKGRPVSHANRAGREHQHDPGPRGQTTHNDAAGGAPHPNLGPGQGGPQVWQSQDNSGFQTMTVQPQLEAFIRAMMQQQQEMTRMAMRELTSQLQRCGARGTCPTHSNC